MANNDIIDYLHYTWIFDEQEEEADENAAENAVRE